MADDNADCYRPSFLQLVGEVPALLSAMMVAYSPPVITNVDGQKIPVIVFPGLLTGDPSTRRLRRSLDAAKFISYGWQHGINRGLVPGLMDDCLAHFDAIFAKHAQPAILIGWSLGGLYARELAKLRPDKVRLVMTLCSPFSGDRRANNAWRTYELFAGHAIDALPYDFKLSEKPPMRTIAVWSPIDGMVAPACERGLPMEADRAVMIRARHMAIGSATHAIRTIIEVLGEELQS